MSQCFRLMLLLAVFALAGCGKSGYSHCVVVEDESDFTGEWLASSSRISSDTVRTEDCAALDRARDGGDGAKVGKVRWAECPSGPDCGEAGEF